MPWKQTDGCNELEAVAMEQVVEKVGFCSLVVFVFRKDKTKM